MSTKIHVASVSEHRVLEVILSGGQEGNAPVGEKLLGEVLAYEAVQAVEANCAYDSDALHARLAAAGKEAVIPLRANRVRPATYNSAPSRHR